jgi:hypothetical protein
VESQVSLVERQRFSTPFDGSGCIDMAFNVVNHVVSSTMDDVMWELEQENLYVQLGSLNHKTGKDLRNSMSSQSDTHNQYSLKDISREHISWCTIF